VLGIGLGFVVALQPGPMSLFLVRSTLRAGWRVGLAIGAGIAAIDGLYAACGAAGAAPLLGVNPIRLALGIAGGAFLLVVGFRTLHSAFRVRLGVEPSLELATPRRAFLASVAGTASNPATIASWAAIFAAASTTGAASTTTGAMLLIAGVAIGSLGWVSILATAVAAARRGLGARATRLADCIAGVAMLGFGGALIYSSTHER
jgi:putative LysE/RhtB family amino acid efflux pump